MDIVKHRNKRPLIWHTSEIHEGEPQTVTPKVLMRSQNSHVVADIVTNEE